MYQMIRMHLQRRKIPLCSTYCPSVKSAVLFGQNPWKTSIVIRGYISTGWMFFLFTWEPISWLNSEVEMKEKVKAQLSVWFRRDNMDGMRNTQGGTALEVLL